MNRFRRKKKDEQTMTETEEKKKFPEETGVDPRKITLSSEVYLKCGSDIFNARTIMREWPHHLFVQLGIALTAIRPFNQQYDIYSVGQLKMLKELMSQEVTAIDEALLRKIED